MWAPKRIDIGWRDLGCGILWSLLPLPTPPHLGSTLWPKHPGVVACLTERSGLDLLLQALQWPPGTEILVSAITIPDMVRIIEQHGLVAIPVDIDPADMAPRMEVIMAAITPKTKAILVAHLFGAIFPMEDLIRWAKAEDILLLEDCAQAFDGHYAGHPQADVVLFSFGPIKTATALGGGLLRIHDHSLSDKVRTLQGAYPSQSRLEFGKRVLSNCLLKVIAGRRAFATLFAFYQWRRWDFDALLRRATRNISGDFFTEIRKQPCTALLRLMNRRLRQFDHQRLRKRTVKGRRLADNLPSDLPCPGQQARHHSFWVFPVQVDHPDKIIHALRKYGFSASADSSLQVVAAPKNRPTTKPTQAQQAMRNVLYLPVYPEMPDAEVERLRCMFLEVIRALKLGEKPAQ